MAGALLATVLSSCADGEREGPGRSPSGAPSTSGSSLSGEGASATSQDVAVTTSPVDALPAETREDDVVGAGAAIREFALAVVRMDAQTLRLLSTDDCSGCRETIKEIEALQAEGRRLEPKGQVDVQVVWDDDFLGAESSASWVIINLPEVHLVGPDGTETQDPLQVVADTQVERMGEQWVVSSFDLRDPSAAGDEAVASLDGPTAGDDASQPPVWSDPRFDPGASNPLALPAAGDALPEEVYEHSAYGSLVAAAYFAELVHPTDQFRSGQLAELAPDCPRCAPIVGWVQDREAEGWSLTRDTVLGDRDTVVTTVIPLGGPTDDQQRYRLGLSTPFVSMTRVGEFAESLPAGQLTIEVEVAWAETDGQWVVVDWSQAAP